MQLTLDLNLLLLLPLATSVAVMLWLLWNVSKEIGRIHDVDR